MWVVSGDVCAELCVWGGPEIPHLGLNERKKAISKKDSDSPDQSQ